MIDPKSDMPLHTAREAGDFIEANMRGLWQLPASDPGVEFSDDGHICAVRGIDSAWPNLLFNPRLENVDVDKYLANVAEKIRAGKLPKIWIRGQSDGPAGLYEKLEKIGFKETGRRPTMVMDLEDRLPKAESPAHFEITQPADRAEIDDWLIIISSAFFGERPVDRQIFLRSIAPSSQIRLYIAWLNGQPVGTTLMFLHAGVAGLHLVSVPEAMRRRGIAARLTLRALSDAQSMGYKAAVLKASPLGEGVYQKLGFQTVSRLILYTFTP